MDAQKVDMFIMTNGSNLPEQKVPFIREKLLSLDDSKWAALSTIQFKNPTTALLLSIFLGVYGKKKGRNIPFLPAVYLLKAKRVPFSLTRKSRILFHKTRTPIFCLMPLKLLENSM